MHTSFAKRNHLKEAHKINWCEGCFKLYENKQMYLDHLEKCRDDIGPEKFAEYDSEEDETVEDDAEIKVEQ